jgi:hypothetical protein
MKISIRKLKTLLLEELTLHEANESPQEEHASLDAEIDRYFAQYESEAKTSKKEGRDFRALTRRLVSEADEDDATDDINEPSKQSADALDMESFVNSVVRLIENYDSLLEVRSTIARRAMNFIAKSYEPDVVESLKRTLRDDHGLVPGESALDVSDEEFQAPPADRAGASPGGGGATG